MGDQKSQGFELDFTAEPAKGFVTYASYAFTDSELTEFADSVQTRTGHPRLRPLRATRRPSSRGTS